MQPSVLQTRTVKAYLLLTCLVICGLVGSVVTAAKVIDFGVNFPFSNLIFAILTYPIVDCVCELWGKKIARQTMWVALGCQVIVVLVIQLSIFLPHPAFWSEQVQYQAVLATGLKVLLASLIGFSISQFLDILIYQRIKELTHGKWLWLRSNISIYIGQTLDSLIFVMIVFAGSPEKMNILGGSIVIKIILSFLMTPFVYLIVIGVNQYLHAHTLAFKDQVPSSFR